MGFTSNLPFAVGLYFYVQFVDTSILVKAPSPILVTVGKEPLSLECSYRTTGSEAVISVNWYHRTATHDSFELIARVPHKNMNLQPTFTDHTLASRGKISTTSAGMFNTVRVEMDPVECTDGGEYECDVLVYRDKTPHKAKVQVHLNEEPTVPFLSFDSASVAENGPVTFTCTASMGQPAGTFRWLVYKNSEGSRLEEVELSGSTSLSKPDGGCSPIGTSTLAIMVSSDDRKVKCIIEQEADEGVAHVADERELDVKYRVKGIEIYTRVGIADFPSSDVIVIEEGEDVHFVCRARGNPRPKFDWSYLPLDGKTGLVFVLTHPELTTKDIRANQSGSYVCVASNYISGQEYSETRSVRVIVKDKVAFEQRRIGGENSEVGRYLLIGGVVTGALLFTVFVSLLSVICVRRCSRKSLVHQIRYTGVKA